VRITSHISQVALSSPCKLFESFDSFPAGLSGNNNRGVNGTDARDQNADDRTDCLMGGSVGASGSRVGGSYTGSRMDNWIYGVFFRQELTARAYDAT
jgi:hypothetical protein